jgi:hypothetical protein
MKKRTKYTKLLKEYPEIITKDQFYRICKISKKTAMHLLDNGLVPCIDSGKKTRKYKIKMTDVIKYFEERDIDPDKFSAPIGWYKKDYNPDEKIPKTKSLTKKLKEKLRAQYNKKMRAYPDVLTTKNVAVITGYNRNSVSKWCTKGLLKSLHMGNQYLIPNTYLLEFMLEPDFRGIKEKS